MLGKKLMSIKRLMSLLLLGLCHVAKFFFYLQDVNIKDTVISILQEDIKKLTASLEEKTDAVRGIV